MIVPLAHGVTRYGVTGDEDNNRYQYAFYTVGTERPSQLLEPGRGFEPKRGAILNFSNLIVRHTLVQEPAFDPYQFDPRPHAEHIQYLSALFDATDPDLSAFRDRGGRMIILQPSADNAVGTPMIAEYYGLVVAEMGQRATDETLRLYIGHGGGHNVTGSSQVDTLTLLENWVEKGQALPDVVTAYDVDTATLKRLRSMPACGYPSFAKYKSTRDPNSAESFTCETRPDPLGFHP